MSFIFSLPFKYFVACHFSGILFDMPCVLVGLCRLHRHLSVKHAKINTLHIMYVEEERGLKLFYNIVVLVNNFTVQFVAL